VGKQGYSVPARWAGRRLRARISETKIAFYNGADRILEVERHRGSQGVYVDWRHVLPQLLRSRELLRAGDTASTCSSRMWRELYDALLSRQSGGRAERSIWACSPWPSNTGWKRSRRKSCASVWPLPGSTQCARELDAASKVVVVDFRADLSSYDVMIAAAGQQEVCHG